MRTRCRSRAPSTRRRWRRATRPCGASSPTRTRRRAELEETTPVWADSCSAGLRASPSFLRRRGGDRSRRRHALGISTRHPAAGPRPSFDGATAATELKETSPFSKTPRRYAKAADAYKPGAARTIVVPRAAAELEDDASGDSEDDGDDAPGPTEGALVLSIATRTQTTGGTVWDAAVLLATWLADAGDVRGRRVLELGAGCGAVGLACAALGARHVRRAARTPRSPVASTHGADAMASPRRRRDRSLRNHHVRAAAAPRSVRSRSVAAVRRRGAHGGPVWSRRRRDGAQVALTDSDPGVVALLRENVARNLLGEAVDAYRDRAETELCRVLYERMSPAFRR